MPRSISPTRTPLRPGDRVRFSRRWLQSTCSYTGDLPFLRGTVQEVRQLSKRGDTYCRVLWDQLYFETWHTSVFSSNLNRIGTREIN
jgi:hypothetical protein